MSNETSLIKTMMNLDKIREVRKNAITTDIKTHVIDTVFTIDTGEWETGIKPKNNVWIIVEQYGDSEIKAKKGHDKWVEKLKKNPKLELKDVMSYGF
jgi:hypothetical protein